LTGWSLADLLVVVGLLGDDAPLHASIYSDVTSCSGASIESIRGSLRAGGLRCSFSKRTSLSRWRETAFGPGCARSVALAVVPSNVSIWVLSGWCKDEPVKQSGRLKSTPRSGVALRRAPRVIRR
jgi:hypothetical protein